MKKYHVAWQCNKCGWKTEKTFSSEAKNLFYAAFEHKEPESCPQCGGSDFATEIVNLDFENETRH